VIHCAVNIALATKKPRPDQAEPRGDFAAELLLAAEQGALFRTTRDPRNGSPGLVIEAFAFRHELDRVAKLVAGRCQRRRDHRGGHGVRYGYPRTDQNRPSFFNCKDGCRGFSFSNASFLSASARMFSGSFAYASPRTAGWRSVSQLARTAGESLKIFPVIALPRHERAWGARLVKISVPGSREATQLPDGNRA
jgi:hypothetical protein